MGENLQPWDRLPDEPIAAYQRFLVYRDLGPHRSLRSAYRAFKETRGKPATETNRNKPKRLSSTWGLDSSRFRWVERARAWDIANLAEHGKAVVVAYIAALHDVILKMLEWTETCPPPATWKEMLHALQVVSSAIPAEVFQALWNPYPRPIEEFEAEPEQPVNEDGRLVPFFRDHQESTMSDFQQRVEFRDIDGAR